MEMNEIVEYVEEKATNISKYSTKLRESMVEIDSIMTPMFKKAGFTYKDTKPLYTDNNNWIGKVEYSLKITTVGGNWGIYVSSGYEEIPSKEFCEASRYELKLAVQRLPQFLSDYAEVINQKSEEYKDLSEKAEKMLAIMKE